MTIQFNLLRPFPVLLHSILHTGRMDYGTFKQRLVDAWGWICSDIRLAVIIHLTVLGNSWISKCHHFTHFSDKNWFWGKTVSQIKSAVHYHSSHIPILCILVSLSFHLSSTGCRVSSLPLSATSKIYSKTV